MRSLLLTVTIALLATAPAQAATFEITSWTGSNDGACASKYVPSSFR